MATHRKDEDGYKRHMYAFKKAFLDFMYKSLNSLEPSSPTYEVKKVGCSGVAHEEHEKEPQDLRGGW